MLFGTCGVLRRCATGWTYRGRTVGRGSHSFTRHSSCNITSCTPVQRGNKVSIYSTATSLLFLPYALEVEVTNW